MSFQRKVVLFRVLFIISTSSLICFFRNDKVDYLLITTISLMPVGIHAFQSIRLSEEWLELKKAYFFGLFIRKHVIPYSDITTIEEGYYNSEVESPVSHDAGFLDFFFGLFSYQIKYKTTRIRTMRERPLNLIEVKHQLDFHFDLERKVLSKRREHDANK